MNDSTAPGYLAPLTPAPPEDGNLDKAIRPAVVGITGLPDALVVNKGQPRPPLQADRPQTWCAVGVTGVDAAVYEDETHVGDADGGLGQSRFFRQEEIEVTASFYGPACRAMASLLRDGFGVPQNRDMLDAAGLKYVRSEPITGLADLVNQEYVRRADMVFRLRRMVGRSYAIRNVVSLAGVVGADGGDASGPSPVVSDL